MDDSGTDDSGTDDGETCCALPSVTTMAQDLVDQKIAAELCSIEHLRVQIVKHHERIRELNFQRNMHSVTSRLPPELLQKIFHDLQALLPKHWYKVTHVCQHWRSVAINSTPLWTTIPCSSFRWCELLLARSGSALLNVFFAPWRRRPDVEHSIFQHLARIRTLDIDGSAENDVSNWNKVQAALESFCDNSIITSDASSALERLNIHFQDRGPHQPFFKLSRTWSAIAPRLHHLKLSYIALDWTGPMFCSLHTLHIQYLPSAARLEPSAIPNVFGQMPALETLHLVDVLSLEGAIPPASSMNCKLPNLKRLHIGSASSTAIAWFLTLVAIPRLDVFYIWVHPTPDNFDNHGHADLFRALSVTSQNGYDLVDIRDDITGCGAGQRTSFSMCYQGGYSVPFEIRLPVTYEEEMNVRVTTNFCIFADFGCLKYLAVQTLPKESFLKLVGHLPHLASIRMLHGSTFKGLIEALVVPVDHPQHVQVQFPALVSITAVYVHFPIHIGPAYRHRVWEPLQDCLMQRHEYGVPIEELRFDSCEGYPADMVTKLSEIVSTVALIGRRYRY